MLATRYALAMMLALAAAGGGYTALRRAEEPQRAPGRPAWTEIAWPFASDQWGRGRAFRCATAACASGIDLYLRAKIGFCNCASAVDDEMVDRIADFDLIGGEHTALEPGRQIRVHGMDGRSRRYALAGQDIRGKSVLAIAFHDRCDMVVAVAVVAGEEPAAQEQAVLAFLESELVLRWVITTLGL